jgi:acetyl esterase/lipase
LVLLKLLSLPAAARSAATPADSVYVPLAESQYFSALASPTPGPSPTGVPFTSTYDVTYCTPAGVQPPGEQTDIFTPLHPTSSMPLVIYIHGGEWVGGDKSEVHTEDFTVPTLNELTSHGYVVASINYRLAPVYPFPAMIQDARCAVRYFRANHALYGIDPNRIAAWGSSAGGHLSNLLGTAASNSSWDDGEWLGVSSDVEAVVDWFGPSDLNTLLTESLQHSPPGPSATLIPETFGTTNPTPLAADSPVFYIAPGNPPFLVQYGVDDASVYPDQSTELYGDLVTSAVTTTLVPVQNAGHQFVPTPTTVPISPSLSEIAVQVRTFLDSNLPPSS